MYFRDTLNIIRLTLLCSILVLYFLCQFRTNVIVLLPLHWIGNSFDNHCICSTFNCQCTYLRTFNMPSLSICDNRNKYCTKVINKSSVELGPYCDNFTFVINFPLLCYNFVVYDYLIHFGTFVSSKSSHYSNPSVWLQSCLDNFIMFHDDILRFLK